MRRRLLISMLAVAVVAVLALGIPLAFVLGRLQVKRPTRRCTATRTRSPRTCRSGQIPGCRPSAAQLARPLPDRYVSSGSAAPRCSRSGVRPPTGARSPAATSQPATSRCMSRPTTRSCPAT